MIVAQWGAANPGGESKPVPQFKGQRSPVGVRIKARLRRCDSLRRDVRKLHAEPRRLPQVIEPGKSPCAAVLAIRLGRGVVTIGGLEHIEASGDAVASE